MTAVVLLLFLLSVVVRGQQQPLVQPFAPPERECDTFTCVQENYITAAVRGPFNLTAMAAKEFGPNARMRLAAAFKKIQVNRPIVQNAVVQRYETGFKVSAEMQLFAGGYDAHYEGIYVAEHGGFVTLHTGITFNHTRTVQEMAAATENAVVNNSTREDRKLFAPAVGSIAVKVAPKVIQWGGVALPKGAAGVATGPTVGAIAAGAVAGTSTGVVVGGAAVMTFTRALVVVFGIKEIPHFTFLQEDGDVGILVTVRARLRDEIYQSVAVAIQRLPLNPYKMSGILDNFVMTNNKMMLVGAFTLLPNCFGDLMCEFLQRFVPPGTRLQFMYDAGFVYLDVLNLLTNKRMSAGIGNIELHKRLVIHDCSFFLDISLAGFHSGIQGTMHVTPYNAARPLKLTTEVSVGLPFFDYQVLFAFEGVYERVFGISFLHIGNIHGEANFMAGAWPTAFRFGTEYWLGRMPKNQTETDSRIRRSAYMGFNLFNPLNWYFYGFLSTLTIQSCLDMIYDHQDVPVPQLPPFIGNTGLSALPGDDGVLISFTPVMDYTIEFVDPARTIRTGFTMAGRGSLFGFTILVNINFELVGVGWDTTIGFEPISIGNGVIQLSKSITELDQGPEARVQALLSKGIMPNATINGYSAFLGMGMGFNGLMTQEGIRISGDLRLFNVVDTHAEVVWNTTTDFFEIRGNITQREGFLDMLENACQKLWKKMAHRRVLLAQAHTGHDYIHAENEAHLAFVLLNSTDRLPEEEPLDEEEEEDGSFIAVKFADGRALSQQKFFDFVPFRLQIDEMSFLLHCDKDEERHLDVTMRIRKTLFGKVTYVHKHTRLDLARPKLLVKEILNAT